MFVLNPQNSGLAVTAQQQLILRVTNTFFSSKGNSYKNLNTFFAFFNVGHEQLWAYDITSCFKTCLTLCANLQRKGSCAKPKGKANLRQLEYNSYSSLKADLFPWKTFPSCFNIYAYQKCIYWHLKCQFNAPSKKLISLESVVPARGNVLWSAVCLVIPSMCLWFSATHWSIAISEQSRNPIAAAFSRAAL